MYKDEFYAAIKLVSGEEVFAKVTPCEEETRTLLLLESPVVFETITIRHMGVSAIQVNPWMTLTGDSIIIIDMEKVITISEVTDEQMISVYNKYLRDKDRDSNETKANKEMGFLSSISDARVSLEKLYKSSEINLFNPNRVILLKLSELVKPHDFML